MSEDEKATAEQQSEQQFVIQKIYLKDASLEVPGAPQIFTEKWEPNVNLDLSSQARAVNDDGVHEVVLSVTVTVKVGDKTAYLVEVETAGVYTIKGFDQNTLQGMVGSFCPNILFPYARETVSDLVTKAGFPQLVLAPVNFDALYAQHVEQTKVEAESRKDVH
jgi:preprotein translocase subunit SecB